MPTTTPRCWATPRCAGAASRAVGAAASSAAAKARNAARSCCRTLRPRHAQPGRSLQYRYVDDGRTRDHRYVVAAERESVQAGELGFNAMRVDRVSAGSEETVLWVAEGVPTPVRLLQRENGQDTYDLRLVEYRGVP